MLCISRLCGAFWLVVCAASVPACHTESCDDVLCISSVSVSLHPSSPWQAATYKVEFDIGAAIPVVCTFGPNFPAGSCDSGAAYLGADQESSVHIRLESTPAKFTITASRDGTLLGTHTITPSYHDGNISGCGSPCPTAEVTLEI
jgi:hypothetical protein